MGQQSTFSENKKVKQIDELYKKQYPALQKLIYVLKQFLLQRDLNEVSHDW